MDNEIKLTEQKAKPVLSIRVTTSAANLPQEIGRAYSMIIQYMNEIGEQPAGMPFTAYYNMDMENLDVEMGFPVSKQLAGRGEIKASELPEGKYVECMYKGPYKEMVQPYDAINRWIGENKLSATGTSYEFYYNSPMDVPESELLTKIVFPVR